MICPLTPHKQLYLLQRHQATAAAHRVNRREPRGRHTMRPYRCGDHWHTTHMPARRHRAA